MTNPTAKTIVQFGAGNIGRSLVGQLFFKAGYEVIFVDTVPEIIEALNSRRRYMVRIKDEVPPGMPDEVWVENVRCIDAADTDAVAEAIADAHLVSTAVGASVLPKLFPVIARGLLMRTRPLSILLCENLHGAAEIARKGIAALVPADFDLASRAGFVATSIGKMAPIMPSDVRKRDPLEVWAEAYNQIIADKDGFVGELPDVDGLILKENFDAYVDRKLFIHNLGHATSAYYGFLAGKTAIWECMSDQRIQEETRRVMWEAGRALIKRYPMEFNKTNLGEHIEDLLRRFGNKALGDTVFRVGRDLARKLSREDRCIGALRLVVAEHGDPAPICRVIAAAFCFEATDEKGECYPDDEAFRKQLNARRVEFMLCEVCGLDPENDRELIDLISREYERLSERRGV